VTFIHLKWTTLKELG
jgi:hypothetical protein